MKFILKHIQPLVHPVSRLWRLLPEKNRRVFGWVILSSIIAALCELMGVASIFPFMSILLDPSALQRLGWLADVMPLLDIDTPFEVAFFMGWITLAALALGNLANACNQWVQQRFVSSVLARLSGELFSGYMRQPYAYYLKRDAASQIKVIFSDLDRVLIGYMSPLLSAFARSILIVVIIALIVQRDPTVAVGAVVVLGGAYLWTYRMVRARQGALGIAASVAAEGRHRHAMEGLGAVKELRVLGREAEAIGAFSDATEKFAGAMAINSLISQMPRYLLEVLAFGGVISVALALVWRGESKAAVPMLALYAFAGYRLLPGMQQIYFSAVMVRYNTDAVDSLEADLRGIRQATPVARVAANQTPMAFARDIELKDLCFGYPGAQSLALNQLSLTLRRGESMGLVGRSGSGKTTLVDLLLGLYRPTSGSIAIDGTALCDDNERAWQQRVGYVPQQVFLANATIAQNIALGVPCKAIDMAAVERAARMAQCDEFINGLPEGLDTMTGERGVKLSGGQRQRLGIARALYHDPVVLVFDEATSALDGVTEDAVMAAINRLMVDRTVIIIAHRLRTIEACDRIVMLEHGQVVAQGRYAQLLSSSAAFRRLAGEVETLSPQGLDAP